MHFTHGVAACMAVVLTTWVLAQTPQVTTPRLAPVAEAQRTPEQQTITTQFASSRMTNAIGTFLHHPPLARIVFAHEHYLAHEPTLAPRERAAPAAAGGLAVAVGLPLGAPGRRGTPRGAVHG